MTIRGHNGCKECVLPITSEHTRGDFIVARDNGRPMRFVMPPLGRVEVKINSARSPYDQPDEVEFLGQELSVGGHLVEGVYYPDVDSGERGMITGWGKPSPIR